MSEEKNFQQFLDTFTQKVSVKDKQARKAGWILETTGSKDAADLKAELETELKALFSDKEIYQKLLEWDRDPTMTDPLLKRQLNVLIRTFKQNLLPLDLLQKMSEEEAELAQTYGNFRAVLEGKELSENDIVKLLKEEKNPEKRKKVWEASKEIGKAMAPGILRLVELRNKAAVALGYPNYFSMMLQLQEVDEKWLFETLETLVEKSDKAYSEMLDGLKKEQAKKFGVKEEALGPWAWSDPFCQGDPLDVAELDELVDGVDFIEAAASFYQKMGIDVKAVLEKSDNFERTGKNQHAFCTNIDREKDVRTLNNLRPTLRWLETLLHELGHAVYELGYDPSLSWFLREYPHVLTTEAMALMAGRQVYRTASLKQLVGDSEKKRALMQKAEKSLTRRQLIFSRFVLVMTTVERELYKNPHQNMNKVWWDAVEKYQKLTPSNSREHGFDWAAKMHLGLAPVYYFSYLLGELFASSIEEKLKEKTGTIELISSDAGHFLQEKLFFPGNRFHWNQLVEHVTGASLTPVHWLKQFANV